MFMILSLLVILLLIGAAISFWLRRRPRTPREEQPSTVVITEPPQSKLMEDKPPTIAADPLRPTDMEEQPSAGSTLAPPLNDVEGQPSASSTEPPQSKLVEDQPLVSSAVARLPKLTEGLSWREKERIRTKQYRVLLVILRRNPATKWEELGLEESFWDYLGQDRCAGILGRAKDASIVMPALGQGIDQMRDARSCKHFLRHVPEGESGITAQILAKSEELFASWGSRDRADELRFWSYWHEAASPTTKFEKLPNATTIKHICLARIIDLVTKDDRVGIWELSEKIPSLPDGLLKPLTHKLEEEGSFDFWFRLAFVLRAGTLQVPWLLELAESMIDKLDQTFSSALLRLDHSRHEKRGVEQLLRIAMARIATTREAGELYRSLQGRKDVPEYWKRKILRTAIYHARTVADWDDFPWRFGKDYHLRSLAKCKGSFDEWYELASNRPHQFTPSEVEAMAIGRAMQQAETLGQWIQLYNLSQNPDFRWLPALKHALDQIKVCPTSIEEARWEYLKNQGYPELAEILSEQMKQPGQQST